MIGTIFMALFLACLFVWLVACVYVLVWTLGTIAIFFWDGLKTASGLVNEVFLQCMDTEGWDD